MSLRSCLSGFFIVLRQKSCASSIRTTWKRSRNVISRSHLSEAKSETLRLGQPPICFISFLAVVWAVLRLGFNGSPGCSPVLHNPHLCPLHSEITGVCHHLGFHPYLANPPGISGGIYVWETLTKDSVLICRRGAS